MGTPVLLVIPTLAFAFAFAFVVASFPSSVRGIVELTFAPPACKRTTGGAQPTPWVPHVDQGWRVEGPGPMRDADHTIWGQPHAKPTSKPYMGDPNSGSVHTARIAIPRALSPRANPHFWWFAHLRMAKTHGWTRFQPTGCLFSPNLG